MLMLLEGVRPKPRQGERYWSNGHWNLFRERERPSHSILKPLERQHCNIAMSVHSDGVVTCCLPNHEAADRCELKTDRP